jgi:hypothetical protein
MNRRSMSAALAAAACCATLAACGGTEVSAAANTSSTPATSASASKSSTGTTSAAAPSTTPGPTINQRGNIVKQLGEVGGIKNTAAGPWIVSFTVDAIRVDPQCDAPGASEPLNGHFIAVDLHVTTDPSLTDQVFIAEKDFAIVGPDGVTDTNVVGYGWECLRNRFPDNPLGPGQEYVGSIVLDTAKTSGALVFTPYLNQDNSGWEWQF